MDPQVLIRTFRRRWKPIVVLAALGAASAAVAEDAAPAAVPVVRYDACHTLLVDEAIPDSTPQWDVRNLIQLANRTTQGRVPEQVAAATGRDFADVSSQVRVGVRNDIRSLQICSVGKTPDEAEELADTFAATLIAVLAEDAGEFHQASLDAAHERIVEAEACISETVDGNTTVTETGDGQTPGLSAADQQLSLCQIQRLEARTDQINLQAAGVPVIPLETLDDASAVEISERTFDARIREGATSANVSTNQFAAVGDDAPTARQSSSGSPIPSSPALRAALGLLVGAAMGIGWVQFTERLDSRLRRKDDVESVLDLPVLAEIPPLSRRDRKQTGIVSVDEPRSRSAESFRALRSALDYARAIDIEAGRAKARPRRSRTSPL